MKTINGIGVSPGIAIAKVVIIDSDEYQIPRRTLDSSYIPGEIYKLNNAFTLAINELIELEQEHNEIDSIEIRDIFAVHRHLLQDKSLTKKISDLITNEMVTVEYAVFSTLKEIQNYFSKVKDPYIRQRSYDFADIEKRLIRHLIDIKRFNISNINEEVIVLAKELTPSQTAELNTKYVQGIAIEFGGETSHSSIVAKSYKIPAVVGVRKLTEKVRRGDLVIVDGINGKIVINPDQATLDIYKNERESYLKLERELYSKSHKKHAITQDNVSIKILSNIEYANEIPRIVELGSDGVGLYRTEFLLFDGNPPDEQQQFEIYKKCITDLNGLPLTLRTFDLGGDKLSNDPLWKKEKNPFLGLRSIRYCLKNQEFFKTQLKAILRASVIGNIKIMFPMITKIKELHQAKALLKQMEDELRLESIEFNNDLQIGIMIETPSAAIMSRELARHVDFFSIGTNDLIQYTLAVDRGNEYVASLYSAANPAVLRLIKMTLDNGNEAGIDVTLCGEMASDPKYIKLLLGMGMRTLSLSPGMIPEISSIINSVSIEECNRLANIVLALDDEDEIMTHLTDSSKKIAT